MDSAASSALKIRILAHRCGPKNFPENTLEAMEQSFQLGAKAIECDVRLTKDKEPIVFHDTDFKRLVGHDTRVGEITYQELLNYKIWGKYKIPHLKDILEYLKAHPHLECYFDLHQTSLELVEILTRLIVRESLEKRTYILGLYSQYLASLLRVKKIEPSLRISLMPEYPFHILSKIREANAQNICIGWSWTWWEKPFFKFLAHLANLKNVIREAKKAGIEVTGGLANTKQDLNWFLSLGITNIWTDNVQLIHDLIQAKKFN